MTHWSNFTLAQKEKDRSAQSRAKGLEFHTRALRIRQQQCGEQFVTAISLHKIGVLLYESGACIGAAEVLDHAIAIFDGSYMAIREKTRSIFYLSLIKADMKETDEAEVLLADAWKYLTQITGKKRTPETEKNSDFFDNIVFYAYH